LNEGLHVYEHRLLPAGDEVIDVTVGRADGVEEALQHARAAREPARRIVARVWPRLDVLDPAVVTAVQDSLCAEGQHRRPTVDPSEQSEIRDLKPERFRLVHERRAAGEGDAPGRQNVVSAGPRALG